MQVKVFKRKKNFRKGGLRIHPDMFWQVILLAGFFVFFASSIFGFYFFKTIQQKFLLPDQDVRDFSKVVSKERIDKVLEYFSLNERKSDEIINSPSPIVDPSR